ncbi:MAG: co-chaperone GroES [Planctomycetota bacterium]
MAKTKRKTTFTPIEDRVMVQATEEESVSRGGIVLPDAAKEKPQRGKVLAAGPGRLDKKGKRLPMPVSAGDVVIFGKYAGNDIEIDGEEYKILRADEILAKLTH